MSTNTSSCTICSAPNVYIFFYILIETRIGPLTVPFETTSVTKQYLATVLILPYDLILSRLVLPYLVLFYLIFFRADVTWDKKNLAKLHQRRVNMRKRYDMITDSTACSEQELDSFVPSETDRILMSHIHDHDRNKGGYDNQAFNGEDKGRLDFDQDEKRSLSQVKLSEKADDDPKAESPKTAKKSTLLDL